MNDSPDMRRLVLLDPSPTITESPAISTRYRWLLVGGLYCYSPKLGKGNDSRRGTTRQA